MTRNAVIIGGGHNGLVAAFYLARAGWAPVVLERRQRVGGGAVIEELHPGFWCPTLSHDTSTFREDIAREMQLTQPGVALAPTHARVVSLAPDGPPLYLADNDPRSGESLRRLNARDADRYLGFTATLARVSPVLRSLFDSAPPAIDHPTIRDLWHLLKTGRRFRSLGTRDAYNLLRWLPMPIADCVRDWFDAELLRATIAARGVSGAMLGPRSAGSTLLLLLFEAHRAGGVRVRGRGGLPEGLSAAASAVGARIRTEAPVRRILVDDGGVVGVRLESGEEIRADVVVSAIAPHATFLHLLDPAALAPDFIAAIGNYRSAGTVAKLNLAVSSLPRFRGLGSDDSADLLRGRIHLGPTIDYLERAFDSAKYGECSREPWLDVSIPSLDDPSLAPRGAHVMSIYAHYAPFHLRSLSWTNERAEFRDRILHVLDTYAPGIRSLIVAEQMLTPVDLEYEYGFSGGHIFHGELSVDQLFSMRPLLGYADYRTPIRGLYMCGAGTHPGGFLSGQSGRLAARRIIEGAREPGPVGAS
jgi:phytoene dehydrogenase-like protein